MAIAPLIVLPYAASTTPTPQIDRLLGLARITELQFWFEGNITSVTGTMAAPGRDAPWSLINNITLTRNGQEFLKFNPSSAFRYSNYLNQQLGLRTANLPTVGATSFFDSTIVLPMDNRGPNCIDTLGGLDTRLDGQFVLTVEFNPITGYAATNMAANGVTGNLHINAGYDPRGLNVAKGELALFEPVMLERDFVMNTGSNDNILQLTAGRLLKALNILQLDTSLAGQAQYSDGIARLMSLVVGGNNYQIGYPTSWGELLNKTYKIFRVPITDRQVGSAVAWFEDSGGASSEWLALINEQSNAAFHIDNAATAAAPYTAIAASATTRWLAMSHFMVPNAAMRRKLGIS